jgi:hypothetical protein
MTHNKRVYKNPEEGTPLIKPIIMGCKTPILSVKYCSIIKPFRYENSPTIDRYSITCIVCPEENSEFLNYIKTLEKNEKVDTILKNETIKKNGEHIQTGNITVKFQGRDRIPTYSMESDGKAYPLPMEDEFKTGEQVVVVYDIMRYTKKNTMKTEHGINFKPVKILWYPK